jgi:hypothetical protein
MKTITLSMIFSLAVIVCEGQTLFAPHYTTYGGTSLVASKTSSTNSLVPIAGVNRSVPLAGASYNPGKGASRAIVHPEFSPYSSRAIVHPEFRPSGPDRKPTVVEQPVHGPHRLVFDGLSGRGQKGISEEDDADGSSAFLPWHRGYFGVAGSANPGGDDI